MRGSETRTEEPGADRMRKPDVDFTKVGGIRLLPLDTASFFLPFGRPVNDYLRGTAGRDNGLRRLAEQEALDFPFEISWRMSTADRLVLDGVDPEREARQSLAPDAGLEPAAAGFVGAGLELAPRGALEAQDGLKKQVEIQFLRVVPPKVDSLPLRPRITLAPPPAKLAKPHGAKSSPQAKPVRPAPLAVAPSAAKPAQPVKAMVETATPEPAQPGAAGKPNNVVEMERKPSWSPAEKPWTEKAAPESLTDGAGAKPAADKAVAENPPGKKAAKPAEPRAGIEIAKPVVAEAAPEKPSTVAPPPKPAAPRLAIIPAKPAPPATAPPPAVEAKGAETPAAQSEPKPQETKSEDSKKEESPQPELLEIRVPSFGAAGLPPGSGAGAEAGFLTRIPLAAKIGVVVAALGLGGYFMIGGVSTTAGGSRPAPPSPPVSGDKGWFRKDAADAVGVRRGRQMQFFEASSSAADYSFEFVGTVETKALGWFFRAKDTRNYYGMKIEFVGPGSAVLTHFAVIDGRESSYNQRPLDINAGPGTPIPVRLEAAGARFTVAIQDQTVEVWTDNRLSRGAVGLMNERDEFGRAGNVRFSVADAR